MARIHCLFITIFLTMTISAEARLVGGFILREKTDQSIESVHYPYFNPSMEWPLDAENIRVDQILLLFKTPGHYGPEYEDFGVVFVVDQVKYVAVADYLNHPQVEKWDDINKLKKSYPNLDIQLTEALAQNKSLQSQLVDLGATQDGNFYVLTLKGKFDEGHISVEFDSQGGIGIAKPSRHHYGVGVPFRYVSMYTKPHPADPDDIEHLLKFQDTYHEFSIDGNGLTRYSQLTVDLADVPDEILGIQPQEPKIDPGSNFNLFGVNSTAFLEGIETLNGLPIATIETDLTNDSFQLLKAGESLKKALVEDNAFVVDTLKQTHQSLIAPLLRMKAAAEKNLIDYSPFTFQGMRFLAGFAWAGCDGPSQFGDGFSENCGYLELSHLDAEDKPTVSTAIWYMTMHYINAYGFYGSLSADGRTPPQDIIKLFQ